MPIEIDTTAPAVGGEAVARTEDGRVVFVAGALPGERVAVELDEVKDRYARGRVVRVLDPSPHRVAPPCPHVATGCGGCDWQHVEEAEQSRLRRELAVDVLTRQGGVAAPVVQAGAPLAAAGLRTTVRGTTVDGRFAYRRRRSHERVPVSSCLVAHPLVEELVADGRFGDAESVTIRVGARTGERMVVVGPSSFDVTVPDDVTVVGADELAAGRRAWIHEEVADRRWRVSAGSFFQTGAEGAEALVAEVGRAVADGDPTGGGRLVDLYAGVGLFAGALGAGRPVVAVERSASSVADARVNLADRDARVVKVALERWRPDRADVAVADPARGGLGRAGVAKVAATGAVRAVLVSCDLGSLGRDVKLLTEAGYRHRRSVVLDLFPHTGQAEVVTAFDRGSAGGGDGVDH